MKTAIIYTSKYGMTEKLASIIVRYRTDVHLFHIDDFDKNLNDYDEIVLGTPIYAGRINKKVKRLLESNEELLLNKSLIVFLCGMASDNEKQVINENFSMKIIYHAKIKYVGGAYQFNKMNFLFKFIVKRIAKSDQDQEVILHDNIDFLMN